MKKPIESATVYFMGDSSVGIPSASFDIQMYICWEDFPADSGEQHSMLKRFRDNIKNLYEELHGDTPTWVMFDFEIAEQNRQEKEFDKQSKCVKV